MSSGFCRAILALSLFAVANAAVVEHFWEATWVWAAPDGFGRPVIGINGEWPCPNIYATKGDQIVVHLTNGLDNQTTSIHWHGINQISTNDMDGPVMATQCPLSPGRTMTYSFVADEGGTFWWHSHDQGQYPDGLRGGMIIQDPDDPYEGEYDEEYILTVSDWYHEDAITVVRKILSPTNVNFRPQIPNSMLLNEGTGAEYPFDKDRTYRFRIISFSAFASFMIHFDSHPMTVIANDAAYINSEEAYMLRLTPGQRYDVLIRGKASNNRNYPFLIGMDQNPDYANPDLPAVWNQNATGYLIMKPDGERGIDVVQKWQPDDDASWQPYNLLPILPIANKVFQLDFRFCFDENNTPRACFDDNLGDPGPYVAPKVPTLYTAATTGEANTEREVYGHVHPLIVELGDVVDIVVNNHDGAIHPFHLHGHHFQVLKRPRSNTGSWPGLARARLNPIPPRRDTVAVMGNSYAVLRFEADNPGVYLFHCHVEWHVEMGLTATIIEAPEELRHYPIPQQHIDTCKAQNIPYAGNAGGNTVNVFDTSNYNVVNEYPYDGPTYQPIADPEA